jgi:hypothetical protein
MLHEFLVVAGGTFAGILLMAGLLHLIPKLGLKGLSEALCRAPLLDLPITYFTVLPLVVGPVVAGWIGLLGAVVGQVTSVLVWGWLHELANLKAARGPRIVKQLNRTVGRTRNHVAVWVTALAVPVFWMIRLAEWVVYPPLIWIVKFPRYKSGEWVNVSRHKFEGLVGHDLIWCLYSDWMTGVWSLGSEMLRNVESFWCPIKFYDGKKCENCKLDFPDVEGGWVPATGTMEDVTKALAKHYTPETKENSWFGHPARLTVKGRPVDGV